MARMAQPDSPGESWGCFDCSYRFNADRLGLVTHEREISLNPPPAQIDDDVDAGLAVHAADHRVQYGDDRSVRNSRGGA